MKFLLFILFPFSLLFFIGVWFRNLFFDLNIFKSRSVSKPVICVGNLTTGGTGKTPWVQFICKYLEKRGEKVLIVSRGYGGDFSGTMEIQTHSNPRQCGDEPLWLKKNTNAMVYIGKDRFLTTQKALCRKKVDVVLLDDGYQHRQMKRDFNIVLLDALAPARHYSMLPVGRMREGFSSLKRADALIITKCNHAKPEQMEKLMEYCLLYIPKSRIFLSDYVFEKWSPLFDNSPRNFKKEGLTLVCALGNPHGFLKTVDGLGIKPIKKFVFPDHYFWKPHDIKEIIKTMQKEGSSDLLTTTKDAVKLFHYRKDFCDHGIQLWICSMHIKPRDGIENLFSKMSICIFHEVSQRDCLNANVTEGYET